MRMVEVLFVMALVICAEASYAQAVGGGGVPGAGGGSANLPTASAAGQGLISTGAGTTYAAQSKIALDPRDFGADFNGASVTDATTTSGSNIITCANSDCHFPANISGYIIFATAGNGSSCLDNAAITFGGNAQTTVTGFTNANSITVSGNSNTTATATACLAWFPKDSTTALTNWWNAGGCNGSYVMPAGLTLFSSPIMQAVSGCAAISTGNGYIGQTVIGSGVGSTFLIPAPTFTYTSIVGANATNCAVGNTNVEDSENFTIYGLGTRAPSSLNICLFMVGSAARATNIDGVGWDSRGGGLNLLGIYMQGITDTFEVGGANYFGTYTLYENSTKQLVKNNYFSGNQASVNAGGGIIVVSGDTTWINNIMAQDVTIDGIVDSTNTYYQGAGETYAVYMNGGKLNLLGNDVVAGMDFSSTGSSVYAHYATINLLTGAASNSLYDDGTNTLTSVTVGGLALPLAAVNPTSVGATTPGTGAFTSLSATSLGGALTHIRVAVANCAGTASAGSTLQMVPGYQAACNTSISAGNAGQGWLAPAAGTVSGLSVRCTTTGVSASSGVFTVYHTASGTNPTSRSATTVTVTYGTTTANTTVSDATHSAAYAAGDLLQLLYTTQGSETMAGCSASFNY